MVMTMVAFCSHSFVNHPRRRGGSRGASTLTLLNGLLHVVVQCVLVSVVCTSFVGTGLMSVKRCCLPLMRYLKH